MMDFHEIYFHLKEILDKNIENIKKKKLASSTAISTTTTTGTTTTTTGTTTTTTGTVSEHEKAMKYFQSKGLDVDAFKEELLVKEYKKQLKNKSELYNKEENKKKKQEKIQLGK
jgi:hypothetical protein